ncbi:MAG: SIS domain-containing protein [Bacteroidota bacterium]|nr:SIS domain-containing protein [Bacteroidota bacterium]
MTKLYNDILNQTEQLEKSLLNILQYPELLKEACGLIAGSDHLYITGIGASLNAGLAIQNSFLRFGLPALVVDSSELLYYHPMPYNSTVIFLSRSGESIEIVKLLEKVKSEGAKTIGITNKVEGTLALNVDVCLPTATDFDFSISISTYSSIILIGNILALCYFNKIKEHDKEELISALKTVAGMLDGWYEKIKSSDWLNNSAFTYFLGRGAGMATCNGARLLWEEAAKCPANAINTSNFRHGPQEILGKDFRIGISLDADTMVEEDIRLIKDMRSLGVKVLVTGQNIEHDLGDLTFQIPAVNSVFQPIFDIIPYQLAAEHLAHLSNNDCDSFRYCSFVVTSEVGITSNN